MEQPKITTVAQLNLHLKLFKRKLIERNVGKFQWYPLFCEFYSQNKEKYTLSKEQIFETACEVLIEEA